MDDKRKIQNLLNLKQLFDKLCVKKLSINLVWEKKYFKFGNFELKFLW